MKAMMLHKLADLNKENDPLVYENTEEPKLNSEEVMVQISTCGVCHTELDEIEGRTAPPRFPVIPGHQVVGKIIEVGPDVKSLKTGDRVGVAWIYHSCGKCEYCLSGNENLCPEFEATGRDANGGYAQFMKINEKFAHYIPDELSDDDAAPLFCAGAIGYRSLNLTNIKNGDKLGLMGFGASGHLVLKLVKHQYPDTEVFVFARSKSQQEFALELGAVWAGSIKSPAPEKLHAIIDTTPVWLPVIESLKKLRAGGRLVINAIRKEDNDKDLLTGINYEQHLWMEKEIKSVANVAVGDVRDFLKIAAEVSIKPEVKQFPLKDANRALMELKKGKSRGAKVLKI